MKGQTIRIKSKQTGSNLEPEMIDCVVVEEYAKYLVLTNGYYRFCAFKQDLANKEVILR
ncbi:MAG: hypothetical protein U0M06_15090 [Clostridia bacterium]|nr:hypothetical protein [Clostridia bacterium]